MERVLASNTARLHSIEKHLEIVRQQPLYEHFADESGEGARRRLKSKRRT
jgi:hypothetical protein